MFEFFHICDDNFVAKLRINVGKAKCIWMHLFLMLKHPPYQDEIDRHRYHINRYRGERLTDSQKQEQVEQNHVEEIVVEVSTYKTNSTLNRCF